MARSKAECAKIIVNTLKQEFGQLLQSRYRVSAKPDSLRATESLGRFIEDGLSGQGMVAMGFIHSGTTVEFNDLWDSKLQKAGVTVDELRLHGFLTDTRFGVSTVVAANGEHEDSLALSG